MLTAEQLTEETHLVIATPCYGGSVFQNYFMSIIKLIFLCNQHKIPISFLVRGGDSLIPRIRNSIVAEVLANPVFTHLLWIDADIGFDPESVIRLLVADRDVVCGLYPLKKLVWPETIPQDMTRAQWEALYTHYPYNPVAGAKIDDQGFIEVLDAPTGMMMIKRAVLEQMCDAYPGLKYTPDHMLGMEGIKDQIQDYHYRLFDVMTEENGRYLSEDYAFCRRWQNIGGKIYIDAKSNLSHQGGHLYTGDFLQSLLARHAQHADRLPEDVAEAVKKGGE